MIKNYFKPLFLTISVIISFQISAYSQTSDKKLNYSKYPYWIDMMNDPSSNYFETLKAYDEFWAKRKKPMEENEVIGQSKSNSEKQTFFQKAFKGRKEREEEETRKYSLDVKKFEHWKLKVKPYIQEDGRILSSEEQLKIWEQQHQK